MNTVIKRAWNKNKLVKVEDLTGMTFQAESGGHTFEISGVDDTGAAVSLSGTVEGRFLRADNAEIIISGTASSGKASVTLSEACYAIPGRFLLTVYVTSGGQKVAVYAATGSVVATSGTAGGSIPPLVTESVQANTGTFGSINTGNSTVNGVRDVTQRRCYGNLSSPGWYRVLTFNSDSVNHSNGYAGSTIDFNIGYKGQNETHKISLHIVNGRIKFDCENSVSYSQLIDKIRYTKNGAVGYVDLHILGECSSLYVDFIVHDQPTKQYQYVAASLGGVDPSPSGETIVAEYTFSGTAYSKTVSAEGTSNGWNYILYKDKTIDATRKITDTVSNYSTVNGFYGYYIAGIATPFTMANTDYYIGTEWAIGNGFSIPAAIMSKTTSIFNAYALGTASGSQSVELIMHLKGKIA